MWNLARDEHQPYNFSIDTYDCFNNFYNSKNYR